MMEQVRIEVAVVGNRNADCEAANVDRVRPVGQIGLVGIPQGLVQSLVAGTGAAGSPRRARRVSRSAARWSGRPADRQRTRTAASGIPASAGKTASSSYLA